MVAKNPGNPVRDVCALNLSACHLQQLLIRLDKINVLVTKLAEEQGVKCFDVVLPNVCKYSILGCI
jgi:hypothetical protein